jgi:hypothetical protein
MNPQDLLALKQQWQAQPLAPPEVAVLRGRIARETRTQRQTLVLGALVTVAALVYTLVAALREPSADRWFSLAFTATLYALTWLTALWVSRGTWRPHDESTAAYLDVSIRRCRSVIVAAPTGIVIYVACLIGTLFWKQQVAGIPWSTMLVHPAMIAAGWIGAPLYAAGMLWNARRHRRRLAMLLDLKRQISES